MEKITFLKTEWLSEDVKDQIYRDVWAEHVAEDIEAVLEEEGVTLSDEQIKTLARRYVNGRYDCNLCYWDNIRNLIREAS